MATEVYAVVSNWESGKIIAVCDSYKKAAKALRNYAPGVTVAYGELPQSAEVWEGETGSMSIQIHTVE